MITPPRGVERDSVSIEKSGTCGDGGGKGGAESGASGAKTVHSDPDLALVVDTWPRMTVEAKQAVLAIVRQADAGAAEGGQERPQETPRD